MTDLSKCKVTFTPPDYENAAVIHELMHVITGQHADDFIRDVFRNEGGLYDALLEEDAT